MQSYRKKISRYAGILPILVGPKASLITAGWWCLIALTLLCPIGSAFFLLGCSTGKTRRRCLGNLALACNQHYKHHLPSMPSYLPECGSKTWKNWKQSPALAGRLLKHRRGRTKRPRTSPRTFWAPYRRIPPLSSWQSPTITLRGCFWSCSLCCLAVFPRSKPDWRTPLCPEPKRTPEDPVLWRRL